MEKLFSFALGRAGKALAILAALAAVIWGVRGYLAHVETEAEARGEDRVMGRWKAADEKAREQARNDREALRRTADEEAEGRRAAEAVAADFEARWRKAVADAKRSNQPLAVVDCGASAVNPGGAPAGQVAVSGTGLRLTWGFLRAYDTAWPGPDGKPLLADPGRPAPPAPAPDPAQPAPVGLDQLLDTHGENARRHAACIRDLNALIDTLDKLQAQYDRQGGR